MQMVLRFLCGVRKFSEYPSEVLNTLCVLKTLCGKWYRDGTVCVVREGFTFDTLHWLFQAQDIDVIAKLLVSSDIQLYSSVFSTPTPFDCFVFGYCVCHSNHTWKIYLEECYIGDEGVEMLVLGAMEEKTHCTGWISKINLSGNCITSEGVKCLLHLQFINKLETLNLRHNQLDSESCAVLAHLIPHVPHLKTLNLSNNPKIGQGRTVPLMTSLTAHN